MAQNRPDSQISYRSAECKFKAEYFTELAKAGKLPSNFVKVYGDRPEQFFIRIKELKNRFKDRFEELAPGAIGLCTYYSDRINLPQC